MKHYIFNEILCTWTKKQLKMEFPNGVPLESETFIHTVRDQPAIYDPNAKPLEDVMITYVFLIGEFEHRRSFLKGCARQNADQMYFREMAQQEHEREVKNFLSWAEPLAQQYPGLITLDTHFKCVWLETGGENSFTKRVVYNTRRGGLVGGDYHNGNQNPSAFSPEEAEELISQALNKAIDVVSKFKRKDVYKEIAELKKKPQTKAVQDRLEELKSLSKELQVFNKKRIIH